ncbi:hypothetical protein ABPG74_022101 [Tetrahymena malaccensis]
MDFENYSDEEQLNNEKSPENVEKNEDQQKNKQSDEQKQILEKGLSELNLIDGSQLENEISLKNEEIKQLEILKKTNQALKRKKSLEKLQKLQIIYEELRRPLSDEKVIRFNELQKQLKEGLDSFDLQDGNQLEKEISLKKEQIKQLEIRNKTNQAIERKKSLEKLQQLQNIYEDLTKSQSVQNQDRFHDLQKQLKEGLDSFDLQDGSQLENEISLKKQEIKQLEIQKKTYKALERKKSLEKLEQLQSIYEDLRVSQSFQMQNRIHDLQKQLNDGLIQFDLQDGSQLESEISLKKEQIKQLEIQKKTNKVLERQKSLDKLQNLQVIYKELTNSIIDERQNKIANLQNQLKEGLDKLDLKDGSQLLSQIHFKKDNIQQLEALNKNNQALERKKSLERLENLQKIYEQLAEPLDNQQQNKLNDLYNQLNEGQGRQFQLNQGQQKDFISEENCDQNIENIGDQIWNELKTKKLIEAQINLQLDIQNTPDCAEKFLLQLLHDIVIVIGGVCKSNDQTKQSQLYSELEKLQRQLQLEGLMNADVKYLLSQIQQNIMSFNWQQAATQVEKLLKQLRPLNIAELKRLIYKTDEAAKLIQNQDILLFLGGTGSGKSTSIHFLAGSPMKELEVKLQGGKTLKYIGPVIQKIQRQELKNIKVSPYAESETRYISPVQLNYKEIGMVKDGSIVLCDAPGFGDTAGPEVDIANGIGMVNAIRGCRSVRPVVLASNQSIGDRGEGIRRLAHTLVGLIKKVDDHLYSFSYLFTKFNDKSIDQIAAILINILASIHKNNDEQSDHSFVSLFEDMVEKTQNQDGGYKIEPLTQKPLDYLKSLIKKQPIQNPDKVFEVSITEKSRSTICDQVNLNKQSIISAMKRNDYHLIKQKLDDMQFLIKTLNFTYLNQIYDESVDYIKDNLKKNYNLVTEMFNRNIQKNNKLSLEDVKEYQKCVDQFKQIDQLRRDHLGNDVFQSNSLIQNLMRLIGEVNQGLNQESILEYNSQKNNFDNFKLLSQQFPQLEDKYKKLCTKLQEIQGQIISETEKALKNNDYFLFSSNLSKIKQQLIYYAQHCVVDQLQTMCDKIIQSLTDHLNKIISQADPLLKNDFDQECQQKIKVIIQKINDVKETYELREHVKIDIILQVLSNLNKKIFIKFQKICDQIEEILNNETQNTFKDIEGLINQMTLIKEIQSSQEQIQEKYHQVTQNVYGKMQSISNDAEQLLSQFNQSPQSVNYEKVSRFVNRLQNAQWMDSVRKDSYNYIMKTISEDLIKHALTISEQLQDIDLDLSSWMNIEQAWNLVQQIYLMIPFEQTTQQLIKYREIAESKFKNSTNDVFKFIQKTFNLDSKALYNLKDKQKKLQNIIQEYEHPLSIQNYFKKHNISDLNEFNQNLELLEDNLQFFEENDKIDYESQIFKLKQIQQDYNDLDKKIKSQNENSQSNKKLFNEQQNLITKSNFQNIDELQKQIEFLKQQIEKRKLRQKQKELVEVFNNYQKLIKSDDFKKEQEEVLKKYDFQNLKALEKELESIKSQIKNSERLDQDYVFGKLDGQIAEDALNYLESSKKIRLLKEEANQILLKFNLYMKKYEENINKELISNIQNIKNVNEEKINDVFKYTQQIACRLQEILDLQPYKKVFQIINGNDIIKKWRKEFSANLIELRDQMSQNTIKNVNIRKHLDITRALTQIDFFITEENNYFQLYKQFQHKVTDGLREIYQKIILLIDKHEFQQVNTELLDAENQPTNEKALEQIKHNINITVEELCETTKSKSISLVLNSESEKQIQSINQISQNLNKIFSAKKYVSKYLNIVSADDNDVAQVNIQEKQSSNDKLSSKQKIFKIDQYLEQIKQIIQEKISNYIDSIQALINVSDFDEAENKRENVIKIQQIIGHLCLDQKITDEIQKLQKTIETNVEKVVEQYIKMDQETYILNPPKQILEKLEIVAKRSISYKQSFNKTKEQILQKIRQQLKEIKNKSSSEREEEIQKIEQALHFLPTDMKDYLNGELKQQREVVQKNDLRYDEELNRIVDSQDALQFLEFQKRCENNKMDNFKTKVLQNVNKLCNQYKNKIERLLEEEQIQIKKVVELSMKLNEFKDNFSITEVNNMFDEIQEKIKKKMFRFIDYMQNTSNFDRIEEIRNKYQVIQTFIQIQHQSSMTKNINLNRNIDSLFQTLSKHFSYNQEKQDQSLDKLNMKQLEESFVFLEKRNEFLTDIKRSESQIKPKEEDRFENKNFQTIIKCRSYEELKDYASEKLLAVQEELLKFEFKKGSESEKVEYYKSLEVKLQVLEYTKKLKKYFLPEKFDADKYDNEITPQICKKVKSLIQDFYNLIQKNEPLTKQELQNLRNNYENLLFFKQEVKVIKFDTELESQIAGIDDAVNNKVDSYAQQIKTDKQSNVIADSLVQIKRIGENLYFFKNKIDQLIDDQLIKYRNANKNDGGKSIGKLTAILEQEPDGIGQIILSEHNIFKGQKISIFNQKTQKHDINYVLNYIEGDNISKDRLKEMFYEIMDSFQQNIKYYIAKIEKNELDQAGVIEELVLQIKDCTQQSKNGNLIWNGKTKLYIIKLISLIFSLWSLQDISYYSDNNESNNRDDFILQPHPGQIVSILRLLGIGYYTIKEKGLLEQVKDTVKNAFSEKKNIEEEINDSLKNNLIEIGTGEGKSVSLAITACILVLLGADVSCACYSQYLSQRDYEQFLPIFNQLGITKNINYGSFTKICEGIINEKGEVRNRVVNLIENKQQPDNKFQKTEIRPKILLIDEVDVFFNTQFYGNVYTPLARLQHSTIQQLTDYLWQQRKNNVTFFQAKNSLEFKNCCQHFQGWESLLEEGLRDMIVDLQDYEHEYEITLDGKIGYKEMDDISYNISYGYKTLFAHYKEFEAERISKTTLTENIFIGIRCGSFSYANIPKEFKHIMGVTGTLKNLSNYEKNIVLNKYLIQNQTFMPSVFGINKRKFFEKEDVYVENQDNYFKVLIEQIIKKLDKRAVLVFFEDLEKLKAFHTSKELAPYEHQTKIITEQVSKSLQEKNMLIKNSTTQGQITLISKIFGRGTDFICRDQTVIHNGGTHVISTFFSEDISEEIQIFGRTARQGQDGSVSLVLLENHLEKYLGSNYNQQLNKMRQENNFYEKLNSIRQQQAEFKYKDTDFSINQANQEHQKAFQFLQNLSDGKKDLILQHLIEQNKGASIVSKNISRTICLMDATESMGILLTKVKETVGTMFKRVNQVLQEKNISDDCFQIQFAIYRDYDCKDGILKFSPWESNQKNLFQFIKTIKAQGGGDFEEAIEIGLQHANYENTQKNISQVILIGDAPSKNQYAIQRDRIIYGGEKYWQKTKFSQMTHYQAEALKLKQQKIPVHCFYLSQEAKQNFEEISQITQGKCQMLDINSGDSSQQLTDLITQSILENIGGEELVKSYQKLFGSKSYS